MYVNVINTATASLAAVEYYLLLVQARHAITCPFVVNHSFAKEDSQTNK